jgi:glycosyltransferase involved in cell wall biosynthesis
MKIAHIITGLHVGGAETMLYKLLKTMDREKHDSIVISLQGKSIIGKKIEQLGVPVHCLYLNYGNLFFVVQLFWILRVFKPEIIQGWMYHGNLAACFAKYFMMPSCKVVWNIRCTLNLEKRKKRTKKIISFSAKLSKKVSGIINNSRVSQQQHEAIGFVRKNSIYIGNGFDVERFKRNKQAYEYFRKTRRLGAQRIVIGNIARFHPMKDHFGLLLAFKEMQKKYDDALTLVLGGRGLDANNVLLLEKITQLGLEKSCILLGPVDTHKVMPVFDVYVSSSAWGEGFPNVIGEAMCCEVPCVVTDVGDSAHLLGGCGEVVPPGLPKRLAAAIEQTLNLSEEKKQRRVERARARVTKNFSIEYIAKQYAHLYENLATEPL